jgi:hypothetical protein
MAVGVRLELLCSLIRGQGEVLALVVDVVLSALAFGRGAELGAESRLELVQMGE